jgi:hypothetical protein
LHLVLNRTAVALDPNVGSLDSPVVKPMLV